jgi:hypothetical protein
VQVQRIKSRYLAGAIPAILTKSKIYTMTRLQLMNGIQAYKDNDTVSLPTIMHAVDSFAKRYCNDLLQTMMDKEHQLHDSSDHYSVQVSTARKIDAIQKVQAMIDKANQFSNDI